MTKNWLDLINRDVNEVDNFIKEYNRHLEDAQSEIEIGDRIIVEAKKLPHIVDLRFSQLQDVDAVHELLDIKLKEIRSRLHRHYLTNFAQKLVSRDVERFVEGEPEYVEAMIIKNKVSLLRNKFASVTKGLEYKHFQLTNIVKLRAAGADDIV